MRSIRKFLSRAARTDGVRKVRRTAGRFGAPGLNPEFEAVRRELVDTRAHFEHYMPPVLNAIASTNGTARLLRRELDENAARVDDQVATMVRHLAELAHSVAGLERIVGDEVERLDGHITRLNGHITEQLWPLIGRAEGLESLNETVAWLVQRVETVRGEMLHEIRYGQPRPVDRTDIEIINPVAVSGEALRLNLGCGHLPLDGFVNVDMRKLPGVDLIAPLDSLPFEPSSVGEIFSAHVLEHFPQAALERQLLPYWRSLLVPGGVLRSVVPDVDAMIDQYRDGTISFDDLREVVYGGQEYEGDFHHTAFTPESLSALLTEAGFVDVKLVERGRENGACLEFELIARRPA